MCSRCRFRSCSTRRNHRRTEREFEQRRRVFFVIPYENRNIWGATAGMLVNLAEVLAG